ncbi:hypothetical protein ACSQ67_024969 [Phaseolus vulgaris]
MTPSTTRGKNDAESLLSEVTTLVCLANVKVKERKTKKTKTVHQIADLRKDVTHLQVENFELNRLRSESTRWAQEKINMHERVKQMEKDINDLKDNFARKEVDSSKTIDALKEDVGSSYVIGFEASMEQVAIIHPRWIY